MTTAQSRSRAEAMIEGRRADTGRRRKRVLQALNDAINTGEEITASGIAARAGVDRSFLYRHRDLLEHTHAADAQPRQPPGIGPTVSRASLQADLLAAQHRCTRLATRIQQLETRLSELLGERAWRESGLGTPDDIDQLRQRITALDQQVIDLRQHLDERDQELAAARAANRDLITSLNAPEHR
jgi:uncharacterized protein YceH (UPF0502 family)